MLYSAKGLRAIQGLSAAQDKVIMGSKTSR